MVRGCSWAKIVTILSKWGYFSPFIYSLQSDQSLLPRSGPPHPYLSHFLLPHPLLSTLRVSYYQLLAACTLSKTQVTQPCLIEKKCPWGGIVPTDVSGTVACWGRLLFLLLDITKKCRTKEDLFVRVLKGLLDMPVCE